MKQTPHQGSVSSIKKPSTKSIELLGLTNTKLPSQNLIFKPKTLKIQHPEVN